MSKKQIKINVKQSQTSDVAKTRLVINTQKPNINLDYLKFSDKGFHFLFKNLRRTNGDFYKILDDFIHEFPKSNDIGEGLKKYSSHRNGKPIKNDRVNNMLKRLPEDIRNAAENEIRHIHFKANGKGKELLWGFQNGNTFYVIEFDLEHKI